MRPVENTYTVRLYHPERGPLTVEATGTTAELALEHALKRSECLGYVPNGEPILIKEGRK